MPPPMPNPAKRFTANPARPVGRYRPGKAVAEDESSDEEAESEEEKPRQQVKKKPQAKPQPTRVQATSRQEDDDDDDEEGFVTDPEDDDDGGVQIPAVPSNIIASASTRPSRPATSVPREGSATGQDDESEESSEEDEDEEEEEEEESSSEEEQPRRKFQRPTFIKKSNREDPSQANGISNNTAAAEPELDEQTRRLAQAELMIKDKLERDALARAQGKKAWDDDEEVAPEDMVDDRDGQDPEAEYQAWKLRELKRLKRDREAIEEREKEIEELERRRNLTAEEREKEDRKYLDKQKEDREDGRGKANYLARYHHKGAFFQDDEAAEILKKRDIMGAKFQDDVTDKSLLPEYMRVRDMTKLGKKGRTRYTDLKGEDTGRFGDEVKRWRGAGDNRGDRDGFGLNGVDERFLPDNDGGGRNGPTGANASAVGQRIDRRSRSRSPKRNSDKDHGDSYKPRRRSYSRSRSRSPPRRKRSPSPYQDRDKRRKVDAV